LRQWCADPAAKLDNGRTVEEDIRGCLEWYICECLQYDPSKLLGAWWSDGVIYVRIERCGDTGFKLLGVTWIGSLGLAPFEIDVELEAGNEEYFRRCEFRIGMLDADGCPTVSGRRVSAESLLEKRPRCNRDWAMAVELTPPPT
jgi:hypothetical protein